MFGLPPRRAEVAALRTAGHSAADIARLLGVTRPTVSFHLRALGEPPDPRFARRYDWRAIQAAHDAGLSASACRSRFGCSAAAWSSAVRRGVLRSRPAAIPLTEVLVAGRATNRYHLRRRLIAEGLKPARCEHCGLTDWRGEPVALQLHHVNGDGRDNRLENLEILCPNCHSQTDTWGARNKRVRRLRANGPAAAEA